MKTTTPRRLTRILGAAAIACAYALAIPAHAQNDRMTPIAIPAQPDAIALNTGALPGARAQESWHSQYGSVFTRNVTVATLPPFLPDPAKATGAAVIVAPGGGFKTLSMNNEGWDVAKALAAQGVAAFVLKYRLNQKTTTSTGWFDAFARWLGMHGYLKRKA
jgi:acetyl esterase/lipase